ncbi:hypothetical protein J6590_043680 [Homalodisca vitripennis]|nr:hypothetical protein J6590_043680 [Homalodisca vitripennis]
MSGSGSQEYHCQLRNTALLCCWLDDMRCLVYNESATATMSISPLGHLSVGSLILETGFQRPTNKAETGIAVVRIHSTGFSSNSALVSIEENCF